MAKVTCGALGWVGLTALSFELHNALAPEQVKLKKQ